MSYHIHIPKLLEFALNVVCDDVTLHGKQCLITPIPYPLYLHCIMTYADKYDKDRYSTYRWYQDVVHGRDVDVRIGRLYPHVLDHVVFDDDAVNAKLIKEVAQSNLVDDAVVSIQRFASRCLAAGNDNRSMMANAMSRAIGSFVALPKPIRDVLLFYGSKLPLNHTEYFSRACLCGIFDDVQLAINNGSHVCQDGVRAAMKSGNCDTIKLIVGAYRGSIDDVTDDFKLDIVNATVQSLELCMALNILQRGKHYDFMKIPSFSVLQWILDHDIITHDRTLKDISRNASCYSGHYFEMLRYLIEQRNFTVPRDALIRIDLIRATDLGVFDYLLLHGADVNAAEYGKNVLERSPMLIRYWIDKGIVIKSNDVEIMFKCIQSGMTAPVLEMMIDKYSVDVNTSYEDDGNTALHMACKCDVFEIVEMLLRYGADVYSRNYSMETPYEMTSDDRMMHLFIQHGYER